MTGDEPTVWDLYFMTAMKVYAHYGYKDSGTRVADAARVADKMMEFRGATERNTTQSRKENHE